MQGPVLELAVAPRSAGPVRLPWRADHQGVGDRPLMPAEQPMQYSQSRATVERREHSADCSTSAIVWMNSQSTLPRSHVHARAPRAPPSRRGATRGGGVRVMIASYGSLVRSVGQSCHGDRPAVVMTSAQKEARGRDNRNKEQSARVNGHPADGHPHTPPESRGCGT